MRSAENDEFAVDVEAGERGRHGLTSSHRGQYDFRAAQTGELLRWILGLAVDVVLSAELPGEGFLVLFPSDGDGLESILEAN
jgi:hypothetical protein